MCWSRGYPAALGETTLEQCCSEGLQLMDRIHAGEVREAIAAERSCSMSDRGSERSQAWSRETEDEK